MTNVVQGYSYKGRDTAGKIVKGRIEAPSESVVVARMRTMGLSPVSIEAAGGGTGLNMEISLGAFQKGVGLKDLAIMSRQLATMVGCGTLAPARRSRFSPTQTENKTLASSLGTVRSQVEGGSSLSEALAQAPTGLSAAHGPPRARG